MGEKFYEEANRNQFEEQEKSAEHREKNSREAHEEQRKLDKKFGESKYTREKVRWAVFDVISARGELQKMYEGQQDKAIRLNQELDNLIEKHGSDSEEVQKFFQEHLRQKYESEE